MSETTTAPIRSANGEIKPGTRVYFQDGREELSGIVNGEPLVFVVAGVPACYVPVHVFDSDRNLMVDVDNLRGILL